MKTMAFSIHKSGQGYWTRMLTAVGAGTLVASGVVWLVPKVHISPEYDLTIRAVLAVVILLGFGLLLWWLLNKPNIVDFLIATEQEMKKVAWPTRRDLVTFTLVVIAGTLLMALLLWIVDIGFLWFFREIGIIQA
jgi:preprotein translocase subunit SecE